LADQEKTKADQAVAETTNVFNQADQKVKQVTPVYQKAVDELTAAERNFKAAQRSVERAAESVKKAIEAIPGFENVVKATEETQKTVEAKQQDAQKLVGESEKPWRAVAISADGKTIATAGDSLAVQLWDADTGAPLDVLPAPAAALKALAFLPDGTLLNAAANNEVQTWTIASDAWKLERVIGSPEDATQIVDRVSALDFSHDGKTLATGSGEPSRSGEIKLWSTENGQLVRALKEPHSDVVYAIEFSPDDQQIASGASDRFVKIFNVADGAFVRSFEGHTHHVLGVSWRADGRVLVSAGADAVVKIWNVRTGDQMFTVQGFNKEVTAIRFVGETDQAIATSGANMVRMVNAAGGNVLRDFPGSTDFVNSVAVAPDGIHVVAGGQDSVLRVWRVDNAQLFHAFNPPASETANPQAAK
jgi:WD40 repeat protein